MAYEGHGINWKVCLTAITVMYAAMGLIALGKLDWIQWRWLTVARVISYPLYRPVPVPGPGRTAGRETCRAAHVGQQGPVSTLHTYGIVVAA